MANVRRAAGGLPLRRMPAWLKPLVGWLMPRIGPRGLEFARARVEMKAIETVLHLEREDRARRAPNALVIRKRRCRNQLLDDRRRVERVQPLPRG